MIETRELRKFGFTLAALLLIFGVGLPLLKHHPVPKWPVGVSAVLGALAVAVPQSLNPLRHYWLKLGHLLGAVNGRILLGGLYVLVFVPLGLAFRACGVDKLRRKFEPEADTYRIRRDPVINKEQLQRTF